MKTMEFSWEKSLSDITNKINDMIRNGQLTDVISLSLSTIYIFDGDVKHYAILIYK